ncbi:hypothetical protein JXQ31_16540 [candidate division KSB1 bacterium]|nr:hypothetical protein [candidate division KSB1 bacterium]
MPDKELKALKNLIQFHIKNHQFLTEQDVYKLLYQGIMGPKHLLGNPKAAKRYLQQEWDSVLPVREEFLFEPVSTDGLVFRINIRPCKHITGNYHILWDALYQSAFRFEENHEFFITTWRNFYQLVLESKLPFSIKKIDELNGGAKKNNYPAMHHSKEYNTANKPAYRVVIKKELEKLIELTTPKKQ